MNFFIVDVPSVLTGGPDTQRYFNPRVFENDIFGPSKPLAKFVDKINRVKTPGSPAKIFIHLADALLQVLVRIQECVQKPVAKVADMLPHTNLWGNTMQTLARQVEMSGCSKENCKKCKGLRTLAAFLAQCVDATLLCLQQMNDFVDRFPPLARCSFVADLKAAKNRRGHVTCVAYGEKPYHLAVGLYNGTVRVWTDKNHYNTFGGFSSFVAMISFSPDNSLVLCQSEHGDVLIWDQISSKIVRTF